MIRHLTATDYRVQPWANGRGQTVELARADGPAGMIWRLSVATVAEDGPFSRLPGVQRSLTVIEGPGFDLVGDDGLRLRCDPRHPVAFDGGLALAAAGVTAPSRDFNAMVARPLPPPEVWMAAGAVAAGGLIALHALGPASVDGAVLGPGETLMTDGPTLVAGPVLAVRIAV